VCFYTSSSDEEAAARLIRTLTVSFPSRARAILSAMQTGSAADVAHAMKTSPAYYTASEETYARGLAAKVVAIAQAAGLTSASVKTAGKALLFSVLGGLGLAGGAYWWFFVRKHGRAA
jgi:hypothetical protein